MCIRDRYKTTPVLCSAFVLKNDEIQYKHTTGQVVSFARSKRANVFAAVEARCASTLSGSALRITFSRYALSEKVGRRACEERNTQTSRNTKQGARNTKINQSALRSKISSSARLTESGSVHFHCAHLATSGCCGACALVKSTLCW